MIEKYNDQEFEINDKNCINVGFKDSSVYVLFGLRQIMNGNKEIIFQGRGNNIPKVIIVSEILKNNYMKDLNFRVEIGSTLIQNTILDWQSALSGAITFWFIIFLVHIFLNRAKKVPL